MRPLVQASSSSGSSAHSQVAVALLELQPRVAREEQQHVGVEVAPGELADERGRRRRRRGPARAARAPAPRCSPSAGRPRGRSCRPRGRRGDRRSGRWRRRARHPWPRAPPPRPAAQNGSGSSSASDGPAGSSPGSRPPGSVSRAGACEHRASRQLALHTPERGEDRHRPAGLRARNRDVGAVPAGLRARRDPGSRERVGDARSRRRANGDTALVHSTAAAPSSRASSGTTSSGRPWRTTSAAPRARSDGVERRRGSRAGTRSAGRWGIARCS